MYKYMILYFKLFIMFIAMEYINSIQQEFILSV